MRCLRRVLGKLTEHWDDCLASCRAGFPNLSRNALEWISRRCHALKHISDVRNAGVSNVKNPADALIAARKSNYSLAHIVDRNHVHFEIDVGKTRYLDTALNELPEQICGITDTCF